MSSRSAASTLMTPLPFSSVCIMSAMLSIGSPKKASPPCCSSASMPRWIAPIDAAETLPYSVVNVLALSPTCCSIARRSLQSSSRSPLSSATLKTRCSTPSWVSFRPSIRDNSSGPMSEIVARSGCPSLPKTSHRLTGKSWKAGVGSLCCFSRSSSLGDSLPALATPARSPLTSAMNTGTPSNDRCSARPCRLTVLPVPVAPVISP